MRARFPWLLAAVYAAAFFALGAKRYAVHRNFVDFGIFAQTISSAFGCFCNPVEGSHWAFHFSPILYVAGAVVWMWHSPYALIAMAAIGGALSIPPVYAIVARGGDPRRARLAALIAFLYPPLQGLTFNDFHENAFAPAAVLWAISAFDGGRVVGAVVLAAVAMCVKEDQALFMAIAGVAAAVVWRGTPRGRAGIVVAALGLAVTAAFFAFIQPHAQVNPAWSPARFYAWTQGDAAQLFPRGMLERAGFSLVIFLPLLFLPFRSPVLLLAIAPFAEILFSRMSTTYTNGSHYAGAWAGYVLAAFALAVRALPQRRAQPLLVACAALCVVELAVANPMHPGLNLRRVEARDTALDRRLAQLPRDVSLATQEEAYTHLAMRDPFVRVLPEDPSTPVDACFVLVDRAFPDSPRLQEYGAAFHALAAAGLYVGVSKDDSIELYRRRGYCR